MNERDFRIKLVAAYGGTGGYSNERDFWNSLLTAVYGTPTRALNEREFWIKFSEGVQGSTPPLNDDQVIVEDGDTVGLLGTTVTLSVDEGELDGASIPGTFGVVEDGDQLPVTGGTVTISVTGNTVTAEFTPD